jgi:hypothetical protein
VSNFFLAAGNRRPDCILGRVPPGHPPPAIYPGLILAVPIMENDHLHGPGILLDQIRKIKSQLPGLADWFYLSI